MNQITFTLQVLVANEKGNRTQLTKVIKQKEYTEDCEEVHFDNMYEHIKENDLEDLILDLVESKGYSFMNIKRFNFLVESH